MRQPVAFVAILIMWGVSAPAFAGPQEPLLAAMPDHARFQETRLGEAPWVDPPQLAVSSIPAIPAVSAIPGIPGIDIRQTLAAIPSQAAMPGAPRPAALFTPLRGLYAAFIGVQLLDVHSTRRAIDSGAGHEANPALRPVAGSTAALLTVKAGTTAAIIFGAERLRRGGHPVAAAMLMVGINSACAMVVAHNYRVVGNP